MSKVKTLLLATASSVAIAGGIQAVQAADLPLKAPPVYRPAFSWTGCHVGAHWGWGWGKKDGQGLSGTSILRSTSHGTFSNKLSGPIFGGQLGCDYQWPSTSFVIGVEGSYSAADINGSSNFGTATSRGYGHVHAKIDSIGSITGRLGFTGWDPMVMLYVRGGWAWAHQRDFFMGAAASESFVSTTSHSGWTVGAGVEWAWSFAPRWSSFVAYDHYDFNAKNINVNGAQHIGSSEPLFTRVKPRVDTVKIGVNYKLW